MAKRRLLRITTTRVTVILVYMPPSSRPLLSFILAQVGQTPKHLELGFLTYAYTHTPSYSYFKLILVARFYGQPFLAGTSFYLSVRVCMRARVFFFLHALFCGFTRLNDRNHNKELSTRLSFLSCEKDTRSGGPDRSAGARRPRKPTHVARRLANVGPPTGLTAERVSAG